MTDHATLETIPTPSVVIDLPTVKRNIERMQNYCRERKLNLRPHTKTHKSVFMAKLQLDAGAAGLTVAKLGEAHVMAQVCDDLLLAYPALDPNRAKQLAELARGKTIHVAIDSSFAADRLAEAARTAGSEIGILVDIDVGFHRTGVQSPQASLDLATHVARSRGLRLDGIMCYPGHIVALVDEQKAPLTNGAQILQEAIDLWRKNGLGAKIVSGGSSPTGLQAHFVPQLTEIRPGTYIYNDMNMVNGEWCTIDDCAARVLCTVVSEAVPGKIVLDAGNKTLTSDRNFKNPDTAGFGRVVEYPAAKIVRLSEEHGEVDVSACDRKPKLGERVHVVPNHVCPCINLHDYAWLSENGDTLRRLPTDARGKVV